MYRQSEKKLLNSNMSSTCPHNMANFSALMAGISSGVWGTLANFNGFRILPSLLQQRRSTQVNQTLRNVWPFPGLLRYVNIFGGSCPLTEFCLVQHSVYVLFSGFLAALLHALQQRALAKLCGVVQGMELPNFRRGLHLYSAGRP